ncbi:uncharacterized protein LOC122885326 isoform X2 [Siniperca chuatsi]|uniref:uncharacterized protein LOC122885326 isoform X2 n=1 Tax=Siniperca chuatsi TaxID=119488 RepID=UPI001CE120B9|nr:uncharacterized protein LOC122885326 isoform X2 [Siniperca chuatsi]
MIHYLKTFTPCHHLSCGHKLSKPRRGSQILSRSLLVMYTFSPSPAAGCKSPLSKMCVCMCEGTEGEKFGGQPRSFRWRISQHHNLNCINCTYNTDVPIKRRLLRLWWIQTAGDGAARQSNPPATFLRTTR